MIEEYELANLLAGNSGFSTKRCNKTAKSMIDPLNRLIAKKSKPAVKKVKKLKTENVREPFDDSNVVTEET